MIDVETHDVVATLRMAHEPANVLSTPFCRVLADALDRLAGSPETRAVVITGTGTTFSAGVDLFALLEGGAPYLDEFFPALERLFRAVATYPKPLVAALNGHAIAGGFVLACGCDFRVMARGGATLGAPELKVGVPFPGIALELIRGAVPARSLRDVILRGRIFGVEQGLALGLVDDVTEPDALLPEALELAGELAALPPEPYALTKRQRAWAGSTHDDLGTEADVRALWNDAKTHARVKSYLERTLGKSGRSG